MLEQLAVQHLFPTLTTVHLFHFIGDAVMTPDLAHQLAVQVGTSIYFPTLPLFSHSVHFSPTLIYTLVTYI